MDKERLQRVDDAIRESRSKLSEIKSELAEIEDVLEAEAAHEDTITRDARDQLTPGESHRVVIETPPGESGPDAVARIQGIVTFVKPGEYELKTATTADIKITDVGDNQAHAVVADVIN